MSYEAVGGGYRIPVSPFATPGNAAGRYVGLGNDKYAQSGLGRFGRFGAGQTSVSQQAQAAAQAQLQPVTAQVAQVGQAIQSAQAANPSIDLTSIATTFQQAQAALQQAAAAINAPVTPWNDNAGFNAGALTQKQQAEAVAIQQAAGTLSSIQSALQAIPSQINALVRTATAAMNQAQSTVQGAISQASSVASQGDFGSALAILNNPSVATAAQAAGGPWPGNIQQALQTIQSQQVNAPIASAKQQVQAAIAQAQALNGSNATASQLQQALAILQGVSSSAAQVNMVSQLSAAIVAIQNALAQTQQGQVSGQIQAAIANANSVASSGDFASALAILQDPGLVTAANQAGLSSQISQAAISIRSQAAAQTQATQQFQAQQAAAQQACAQQAGMIWTPGYGTTPGTCAPTQQSQQQQAACAAQGGTWTGYGCDMAAVQAASAAAQQAAQQAAAQQAAQIQLQQQQQQEQFQLQQGSASAQAQAMAACANNGGQWNPAAATDAQGNAIGACDMSFVQGEKAQTQQLSAIAQLAQAFMPFLQANPQLATQVVGQAFGIAASVPGGAPGQQGGIGINTSNPSQSNYQDWNPSGKSVSETF